MKSIKQAALIERIMKLGLPSLDRPLPLVTLEEFFLGNDDYGSIGCNLTPMLGPQFFYDILKSIRSKPNVQDVLVEVIEVEEGDSTTWPFSDRVYIFTDANSQDVASWTAALRPDAIEEGFASGRPPYAPDLKAGYRCFNAWWD